MTFDLPLVVWAVSLAGFGFWAGTLYDAVQWSDSDWERAGLNKTSWFLIIGVLSVIGGLLYLYRARPRLERITRRM